MASVTLIKPRRIGDHRGWFSETYSRRAAAALGIAAEFVQQNQSLSRAAGTVRGLHFQRPPHAQAKLVRCLRGAVIDYAVDVRRGSPTYGAWVSAELTGENGWQLYIPIGFAHAFMTVEDESEVAYQVTDYYAPEFDDGIRFDDPEVGLAWPADLGPLTLSPKDRDLPPLSSFESPFGYDGEPLLPLPSDPKCSCSQGRKIKASTLAEDAERELRNLLDLRDHLGALAIRQDGLPQRNGDYPAGRRAARAMAD